MNATQSAAQVFAKVAAAKPLTDERDCRGMVAGEHARQGDVYVVMLAKKPKVGKVTMERQAAPGTTQGSRHMIVGDVKVFLPSEPSPLIGPVIVAEGDWRLEHPEHAHFQFPAGCFQIRYQRDFAQEALAAVQD